MIKTHTHAIEQALIQDVKRQTGLLGRYRMYLKTKTDQDLVDWQRVLDEQTQKRDDAKNALTFIRTLQD